MTNAIFQAMLPMTVRGLTLPRVFLTFFCRPKGRRCLALRPLTSLASTALRAVPVPPITARANIKFLMATGTGPLNTNDFYVHPTADKARGLDTTSQVSYFSHLVGCFVALVATALARTEVPPSVLALAQS